MAFSQLSGAHKKGVIRTVATSACALALGLALCTTYGCGNNASSSSNGGETAQTSTASESTMSADEIAKKAAEAEDTLKTGKRPILSSTAAARIYGSLGDDYKTEYNFCMAIYKYENRSYAEAAEFIKDVPADFELGGFSAKDYAEKIAAHQD